MCKCGQPLLPFKRKQRHLPHESRWTYAVRNSDGETLYLRISPPCTQCGLRTELALDSE
ncbi:MAG: hypothetical protein IT367_04150 [Candidatus Hydrogenedentes bacterium]|nr:hypothetical protein [Candidatus Hydrogenedentota bacterium]